MEKYPVIFLDLDGVVNCCECDKQLFVEMGFDEDAVYDFVSPFAIERISEICKQTGAHVLLNGTCSKRVLENEHESGYEFPDGTPLLEAMRMYNIPVDGYTFSLRDGDTTGSKMEGAAKYLYQHPEISGYVFLEDGKVTNDEDKEKIVAKFPELQNIIKDMNEDKQIDTNRYSNDQIWGQPYGLCDNDVDKVVNTLFTQINEAKQEVLSHNKKKIKPCNKYEVSLD